MVFGDPLSMVFDDPDHSYDERRAIVMFTDGDDVASERVFLTVQEGLNDVARRWVVSGAWADWHDEIAWMSLYFSVAVWAMIALPLAPRLVFKPESRA